MAHNNSTDLVSNDAWRQAQEWEESHWVNAQKVRSRFGKNLIWKLLSSVGICSKYRGDDWNLWWKKAFDDYSFLPDRMNNAIEVGCGPYTNIRLMRERCHIEHLALSDPLIRTYVKFKLTLVSEMHKNAACLLDDHPAEDLPFADGYFDLVVMINVLDHVRDAGACMNNLIRIIKPGGILIFGQDLSNEDDVKRIVGRQGAIAHPIRLDHDWFQPYLNKGFQPIISKVLEREQSRDPEMHYGTLLFAGRKESGAC